MYSHTHTHTYRVLLDSSRSGSPVVAERVLLQPFHMLLALERNLCSWYTKVPYLAVNLNMGELTVSSHTGTLGFRGGGYWA